MCRYVHTLFILNILTRQLHMKTQTAQNHSLKSRCLFFFLQVQWGKSSVFIRHTYEKASAGSRLCWRLLLSPPTHPHSFPGVSRSSCKGLRQRLLQQAVQRNLNLFTSCMQIQQGHIQARRPVSYVRVRSHPFKPH